MRSCPYDQVFVVPSAKDFRGHGNDNRNGSSKQERSKISIAWWLVPCMAVWAASALILT